MTENTRERSLWAWGWADKFPDDTARAGLVQLGKALLPTASPALRALPGALSIDDAAARGGARASITAAFAGSAALGASDATRAMTDATRAMTDASMRDGARASIAAPLAEIPAALADFSTQDPRERAMRTRGRAFPDLVAGFAGDYRGAPDIVARPRTEAEVHRVLEIAHDRGWVVVPFGGGTSVVGGVDSAAARLGGRTGVWEQHARVWTADSVSGSRMANSVSDSRMAGSVSGGRMADGLYGGRTGDGASGGWTGNPASGGRTGDPASGGWTGNPASGGRTGDGTSDGRTGDRTFHVRPGDGTSGGRTTVADSREGRVVICLDLGAMGGVREIDMNSRLARIGAGALGPALEDELAKHGLTLRHYPQSFEFSTLGGWLATRAGGHYATGPTRIDELCHSLSLVTPRGTMATHRHPGSGAGPEANRLVLGSEGALGVITEAWMRVVPRPRWRASASVAYREFENGVAAAKALAQSGLLPSNARLLDGNEARLHRVRFDGSSVLLVGFESADHPLDAWMARAMELAKDHGGEIVSGPTLKDDGDKARSGGEADKWRQAFFDAPYLQSALLSIGVLSDTFETACSWSQFPALHARIVGDVQRALDTECGGGIVSCRFTHVYPDGPAPYYTFIGALRPGAEIAQWCAIKAAASDALAAAGGTITHHHAVGRTHRPWYEREQPPLFGDALAAVKRELDPRGVMNPGVLIG